MICYGIAALVLMVGVFLLGVRAAHRLVGPAGSTAVVLAGVAVLGVVARDRRRKAWSLVSITFACAYGASLAAVLYLEVRSS